MVRHTLSRKLILKDGSVRYNTANTQSCKGAKTSKDVLKLHPTLGGWSTPLPPIGKTLGIYNVESRLASKLEAIFILNRTSYIAFRILKRLF